MWIFLWKRHIWAKISSIPVSYCQFAFYINRFYILAEFPLIHHALSDFWCHRFGNQGGLRQQKIKLSTFVTHTLLTRGLIYYLVFKFREVFAVLVTHAWTTLFVGCKLWKRTVAPNWKQTIETIWFSSLKTEETGDNFDSHTKWRRIEQLKFTVWWKTSIFRNFKRPFPPSPSPADNLIGNAVNDWNGYCKFRHLIPYETTCKIKIYISTSLSGKSASIIPSQPLLLAFVTVLNTSSSVCDLIIGLLHHPVQGFPV